MIVESKRPGGFYINSKFVLADNWEISKERFTKDEQLEFQEYLKNGKRSNKNHKQFRINL